MDIVPAVDMNVVRCAKFVLQASRPTQIACIVVPQAYRPTQTACKVAPKAYRRTQIACKLMPTPGMKVTTGRAKILFG